MAQQGIRCFSFTYYIISTMLHCVLLGHQHLLSHVFLGIIHIESIEDRGTWVAQSVELLTLGFGLGHDPRDTRSSPTLGSTLSLIGILSLPLLGAWMSSLARSIKIHK